ncbi:MAG: GNAT family N-acetyltransferase [Rhodobacteraceae bacterium]|nr:GNAT family N-acetyltransferase [Paracoccaceae bacterium]
MFNRRSKFALQTDRLVLRLPRGADYAAWAEMRQSGVEFLAPWEPVRNVDYPSRRAFQNRAYWAAKSAKAGTAYPFLLTCQSDGKVIGGLTLDNVRRGPSKAGSVGYWIGPDFARMGYMAEALEAVTHYAFTTLDLSRIEAACLPENKPSRALLEKSGFKYEGVAQSYLQIAGRWRTHVLYASLRGDRRGKTNAG